MGKGDYYTPNEQTDDNGVAGLRARAALAEYRGEM